MTAGPGAPGAGANGRQDGQLTGLARIADRGRRRKGGGAGSHGLHMADPGAPARAGPQRPAVVRLSVPLADAWVMTANRCWAATSWPRIRALTGGASGVSGRAMRAAHTADRRADLPAGPASLGAPR